MLALVNEGSAANIREQLKEFVENNHVALPVAIVGKGGRDFEVVMDRPALASCNGDPAVFVKRLREMGLLT